MRDNTKTANRMEKVRKVAWFMDKNYVIFYFLYILFAFEGKHYFAKDRFEEREYKDGIVIASG